MIHDTQETFDVLQPIRQVTTAPSVRIRELGARRTSHDEINVRRKIAEGEAPDVDCLSLMAVVLEIRLVGRTPSLVRSNHVNSREAQSKRPAPDPRIQINSSKF